MFVPSVSSLYCPTSYFARFSDWPTSGVGNSAVRWITNAWLVRWWLDYINPRLVGSGAFSLDRERVYTGFVFLAF